MSPKTYSPKKCQKASSLRLPEISISDGGWNPTLKNTTLSPPRVWIHQGMGRWPFSMVIATSHGTSTIQGLGTLYFRSHVLGTQLLHFPPFQTNMVKLTSFFGDDEIHQLNKPTELKIGGQVCQVEDEQKST